MSRTPATASPGPAGQDGGGGDGVGAALAGAAAQVATAADEAMASLVACERPATTALVVACAPRAAGAGGLLDALVAPGAPVPVTLTGHHRLPAHVGPGTVVVAVGLGPAEAALVEPVALEGERRGATVVRAGAGGQLELGRSGLFAAAEPSTPLALAPLVELLPGLLAVAGWAGALPDPRAVLDEIGGALSACARAPLDLGLPGTLARRIGRAIPLVEGAAGAGAVAAVAWRRAWNLVAKAPAIVAVQPAASVGEVAGFGQHGDVTRQLVVLVSLRTPADHPDDRRRSEVFAELVGEALVDVVHVDAAAPGVAGSLAELCWLGVATAYARARQEGLVPGPVPAVDELEERLRPARPSGPARPFGTSLA